MKKYFYNILTMAIIAMTAVSFASCEDAEIAYTLEGTWRGNMYISTSYDGRVYNSTYTVITFEGDPFSLASGSGKWVDYYPEDAPWDYIANHITWEVNNRVIYIRFREEGTSVSISDYRLNDDRFVGTIYDNGQYVDFELYHTSSPNWNSYRYYDSWYNDYYYSRTRGDGASDSTAIEKPRRFVRGK